MSTLLSFSLVILLIVFFHELGHFAVARAFGIKVKVFSVGIGPKLISRIDKKGTEWRLCILPLGGYVEMVEGKKAKNIKDSFDNKTVFQRLMVVLAGPMASLILGWVVFFGVFSYFGAKQAPNFAVAGVGEVLPNSPADIAGLKQDDVIINIAYADKKQDIKSFLDVYNIVQSAGVNPMILKVKRGDVVKDLNVVSRAVIDSQTNKVVYRIGFKTKPAKTIALTIGESFDKANVVTGYSLMSIYKGVVTIFTEGIGENIGGPVKIAQVSGQAGRAGIEYLLSFIAMLSINLAVINMLPLPIMDGGRALLLLIEGIVRKPVPKKITQNIMIFSVWFIMLFFVFITLKDLGLI